MSINPLQSTVQIRPLLIISSLAYLLSACGLIQPPPPPTPTATATAAPTATPTPEPTLPPTAAPTVVTTGCVEVRSLRVRRGPGTEHDLVGGLISGDCVTLVTKNPEGTWAQIEFQGLVGWVSLDYLVLEGE